MAPFYSIVDALLLLVAATHVSSFNVDVEYPILIQHSVTTSGGGRDGGNYFGASVALLKADSGLSWIVIGAPKANSSLSGEGTLLEPGMIWECSLGRSPAELCRRVQMDSDAPFPSNMTSPWRSESYLGGPGSMAVDSSSFVACASKWEDRGGDDVNITTQMHGACYRRPRGDLLKDDVNVVPPPPPAQSRLVPLIDKGKKFWRFGQAGFAVHLPKSGREVVMGAPGLQRWTGSIIQYLSSDHGGDSFRRSFISDPVRNGYELSIFNYFGYSVTSGAFFDNPTDTQYVGGAPRGGPSLVGKVLIFQFPRSESDRLINRTTLLGEQTGSYFGATLLAIDINGDGYDDLLVGAPRFSRDMRITPRAPMAAMLGKAGFDKFGGYGDEGAVYIYVSNGVGLVKQSKVLHGGNRAWSQFGTAMAALGDINGDGFQDFAVSAPFDPDSGTVYIYHGARDGIIIKYAQLIRAKDLDSGLSGFGISLAGNVDIDGNGYNDLAIGAFNSSQTVVLRSKPIITVGGEIRANLTKLPLGIVSFEIEACVSYTGRTSSTRLGIKLTSDANSRTPRVHIRFQGQSAEESRNVIDFEREITEGKNQCFKFSAIVVKPLEQNSAAVTFRQEIYIPSLSSAGGQGYVTAKPRRMDISTGGFLTVSGQGFDKFCKTCPVINEIPRPQHELSLPLAVDCGDDDICRVDLKLDVSFREIKEPVGFVVGSSPTITMDVVLFNSAETAISPAVLITWRRLHLSRLPGECSIFRQDGLHLTYRCSLGQLLEEGKSSNMSIQWDVSSLVLQESLEQELVFNVTATTVSELLHPESAAYVVPLIGSADLEVSGSERYEPFNPNTLQDFFIFQQSFEVELVGESSVANVGAVFDIPVNLTTADDRVINVRGVTVSKPGVAMLCTPTRDHFVRANLTGFDYEDDTDDMVEDIDYGGIGGGLTKDKDITRKSNSTLVESGALLFHCASPFVACMEVTCKTALYEGNLNASTMITFTMDIETDVLRSLMKTHGVSKLKVESKGRVILPDFLRDVWALPNASPDETVAKMLVEIEGHKPVSKWIYTLSIVIGLVIFACIVLCVYACGCFEKKKLPTEEDQAAQEKLINSQKNGEGVTNESAKAGKPVSGEYNRNSEVMTPFSEVGDPPDFTPVPPTIPEEEDENHFVYQR